MPLDDSVTAPRTVELTFGESGQKDIFFGPCSRSMGELMFFFILFVALLTVLP